MPSVEVDARFRAASGASELGGIVHPPAAGPPKAALVVAHGRSNDMRNPFVRRICDAASQAGFWALRFTFRYAAAKRTASRDLSQEEDDFLGAVRYAKGAIGSGPVFAAGKSMGARVCARASADPDIAGLIALGYPLHPQFRPQVTKPPEWPKLVKPALFIQGDHDPFCDLARLRDELPKLPQAHELVVIPNAGHSFEPRGAKRDTFPEVWEAAHAWILSRIASVPRMHETT